MTSNNACQLSDAELEAEVRRHARRAREATAHLVALLAELDSRRLYLAAGFSSLFGYCTEALGLSDHKAYNRIEAARAARAFPFILDLLHEGSVNLTTVRLLAPHLTRENHRELLLAASRLRKREVEELLARHFPKADVAPAIRKLPVVRAAPARLAAPDPAVAPHAAAAGTASVANLDPSGAPAAEVNTEGAVASPAPAPAAFCAGSRPLVAPLSQDRYLIKFTASAATRDKLRQAQDLLRHAVPNGDVAEVIDRALTVLVDRLTPRKFGATERPRNARPTAPGSRHVPAEARRAVHGRHDGRCGFVGRDGRRCTERGFIEFHHVRPYGVGGEATPGNIELRCRAHNAHEARLALGEVEVPVALWQIARTLLDEGEPPVGHSEPPATSVLIAPEVADMIQRTQQHLDFALDSPPRLVHGRFGERTLGFPCGQALAA